MGLFMDENYKLNCKTSVFWTLKLFLVRTLPYSTLSPEQFKKTALVPHDFGKNFYLIWFINRHTTKIDSCSAMNFPWWLIWAINTEQTVKVILHLRHTAIAGYEVFSGHIFNEQTWHNAQNWNSALNKEKARNVINSTIFYNIFWNFQPAEEKIALRRIRLCCLVMPGLLLSLQ